MIQRKMITEKQLMDEIKWPILFFSRNVGVSSLWAENSQQSFCPFCHLLTLVPLPPPSAKPIPSKKNEGLSYHFLWLDEGRGKINIELFIH